MNLTKVKHHDGKETVVEWTEQKEGTTQSSSVVSNEAPDVALPAALKAFVPLVAEVCDLSEEWEQGMTVTGVSFSTEAAKGGKPERRGIVVTFRYTPSGFVAPMLCNTPHLRDAQGDESDDDPGYIPKSWHEHIDALTQAAVKFIQGARSQQELPIFAGSAK